MNILYVGFYELPDKEAAANRVVNNAKALIEAGHTVMFIDEKKDVNDNILHNKSSMGNIEVWSTLRPTSFRKYIAKMISISSIKRVVNQTSRVDIIIAYNYPAIALSRLRVYCKKKGIKLVSDCTEWYSGKEYSFPKSIFSAIDSYLRMNVIQKKLDGLICISSYLEEYYKENKCVIKVPPLVDIHDSLWHQEKCEWSSDKINLIYAGNPGKSKELILPILQAISKSINRKNIIFRIVGITEEQFEELYPEQIGLVKELKDSVLFLGRQSHYETVRMVSSSDYMIFMRQRNRVSMAGFSTKFVEAISCGTPVITTDTGDLCQFLEYIGAGVIVDNTDDLIACFNNDFKMLKEKAKIKEHSLFDYRKYVHIFSEWTDKIMQ